MLLVYDVYLSVFEAGFLHHIKCVEMLCCAVVGVFGFAVHADALH